MMKTTNDHIYPLLRKGFSVTFAPTDCLNPQVGITCILEGPFGRVSGDSVDSIPLSLHKAVVEYSGYSLGHHSNRRPILSLADQVLALPESALEELAESIGAELLQRRYKKNLAEIQDTAESALDAVFTT